MNDAEGQLRREVALFRYGLIADLIHLPPGTPGIGAKLRAKAEQQYTIPGTLRTRVAAETLRDWLLHYRRGGFDALYPKTRADRGRPRRLPPEVAELLISIKTEHPSWSVRRVTAGAIASGHLPDGVHPAHSTVHRLLRAEGLMRKPTATTDGADRRRFSYRFAGQLWMSDVMHGPTVSVGKRRRKSYLISFLDDATRVSPFSAFALAENTVAFLPVFKQALIRRGVPQRLYVDNGANYRSQQLALICAKLGVALIHARPYQPAGKGKVVMRTEGGLRRRIAVRRAAVTTLAPLCERPRPPWRKGTQVPWVAAAVGPDIRRFRLNQAPTGTCRVRRAAAARGQSRPPEAVSAFFCGCPDTTSLLGGAL